jgi:hypothetical protein
MWGSPPGQVGVIACWPLRASEVSCAAEAKTRNSPPWSETAPLTASLTATTLARLWERYGDLHKAPAPRSNAASGKGEQGLVRIPPYTTGDGASLSAAMAWVETASSDTEMLGRVPSLSGVRLAQLLPIEPSARLPLATPPHRGCKPTRAAL